MASSQKRKREKTQMSKKMSAGDWSSLQFIEFLIDQIYNLSNSGLTEVTIDQICNS